LVGLLVFLLIDKWVAKTVHLLAVSLVELKGYLRVVVMVVYWVAYWVEILDNPMDESRDAWLVAKMVG
jgi:hypothetical protein